VQLEQDSGKSLHDDEISISLIDLNRAGLPERNIPYFCVELIVTVHADVL